MKIYSGSGVTQYGPGVQIDLKGSEVARAISTYLHAHEVYINGPMTITVNGELCEFGEVYVDPSGKVVVKEECFYGNKVNSKKLKIK